MTDKVWYYNVNTGVKQWNLINNIPSPASGFTHKDWKQYVIMETINKAFTDVSSSELNLNAYNQGVGFRFVLPHIDKFYNKENIIDRPGFFALLDGVMIGFKNDRLRTFSFAGSQINEN